MHSLRLWVSTALALAATARGQEDITNAERVEAALAALTVTNLDDVRGNLHLPTTSDGLTVTWESNSSSVITSSGVVKRQSENTPVALTASINHEGVSQTRELVASVRKAVSLDPFEGYAFSYFTGSSRAGENIFFAASEGNNALEWTELNGGQPAITSSYGTKGLRDPFLIRSPEGDTFYLIATDLSIGSGTSWGDAVRIGSRYLEVWESHDLKTWSEQRHILVSPPEAGNTWAPEAYYDEELGAYLVFWASSLYEASDVNRTGSTYHRMLYATTRDFVTFSETSVWQDAGMSRIDSTVIKSADTYYRFTKDEGASGTGCSDIIQESSESLRSTLDSWTIIDSCIGRKAGTSAVEGPTAFKSNTNDVHGEKFYLFVDEYGGRGYIPLETTDIGNPDWKVSASYNLPASPRHGTVIPVTAAELAALKEPAPARRAVNADGEILRYDFSTVDGTQLQDVSGNGNHAAISGGASVVDGALAFDGVDDFVQLPNNILSGVEDIAIEAEVFLDASQQTPYFIYGLGNTAASGNGNGYLFATGSPYRASITTGDWSTERTAASSSSLPQGTWLHLVYTITGRTSAIFLNGYEVARNENVNIDPRNIGNGVTTANYIGKSVYSGDKLFKGQIREFAIFNRSMTAAEVLSRSGNVGAITGVSLADSSALKVPAIIDTTASTVLFAVQPGTDLTTLSPTFTTTEGVISSPASGTAVDLSAAVKYLLEKDGESVAEWTVSAVEMGSPILPGLYADPNIAVFNGVYYIYVTSDGVPGWGGNTFYSWKSTDLVTWTRGDEPFLTLDGANGNVPWATGNAWAPTIAERHGKYYFYFSGHNAALNTKTIGVAVADAPEGPFTAEPEAMILNNEAITASQAIDPAAFHDPVSGKYYIYWGNGRPLVAELNEDMISVNWDTLQAMSGLVDFREGLFVVYRDGLYHLTYSIDDTGSENYRVGYATSASFAGPWAYHGVILQKDPTQGILGTGHNSMFNVPGTDDWYIVYHRFAIPGGGGYRRETAIDRVTFDPETGLINPVVPTLTSVGPQTVPHKFRRMSRVMRL
ncbi:glycosyl hydrolase family 43 [Colletotrichum higginsianum]|uniref:Endo-1,5-alpha-L-arabinanase A n=2 Tax=Colletotrichum higginsianum TaxID=80884 RepID=H1UY08_COLHI|nr:Glycosyl hydrolase family 43 [Colletotrichum higginsianum IMI 349063]OBR16564.1 Glycosyl hydrolase family 43 [Colletotrichum higginsianum IMI 349063]TID05111.1 Xylosidase/arabinosidase [Colletotrichum higginsianum]CCF32859.1 glycosyl hydrolase family 43 [Colletotrichum higginsianum]